MDGKTLSRSNISEKMFQEISDKSIFNQVKEYAFEYADNAFTRNVFPRPEAIDGLKTFDEELPVNSTDAEKILWQLHNYGSPATIMETGGRFFGFVIGGTLPVTIAARWLSDFWDQNAGLYMTSPIASRLETVVEKWLPKIFGLPKNVVSGFVSGTTTAVFCALAAARYRVLKNQNWDVNAKGLFNAPKVRIIAGMHAHGAVLKSISMLGLGRDNIEWIDVDDQGRIIPERVPELDRNSILDTSGRKCKFGFLRSF